MVNIIAMLIRTSEHRDEATRGRVLRLFVWDPCCMQKEIEAPK
jgi:hypothetical protein